MTIPDTTTTTTDAGPRYPCPDCDHMPDGDSGRPGLHGDPRCPACWHDDNQRHAYGRAAQAILNGWAPSDEVGTCWRCEASGLLCWHEAARRLPAAGLRPEVETP